MAQYRKRLADKILSRKLEGKGAVLIQGPKWCGKTTTAEQQAKSVLYMDDPETMAQNLELATIQPKKLLEGETPRLIDEWQLAPNLWDTARFEIDHRDDFGQFIFTGSAVPPDTSKMMHTGTGRFSWLTMRTMTLFESLESTGDVSLKDIFEHKEKVDGSSKIDIDELAYLVCRGGWPKSLDTKKSIALDQATDYVDAVVNSDINRFDQTNKNPAKVRSFMRSYARNQGSQAPNTAIARDISVNEDTVSSYINALKNIFVVEDMPAWNPNLRSKTSIRSAETRYFIDPSIAAASLGIGPDDLINDLKTFGFLFETLCIRDLRVYAESMDGCVYHYRDKNDLECDAVIHLRNGKYGLIEIKLGGENNIEEGAKTLKNLASIIDTKKMNEPSFLMVLTGIGNYAYTRKDGVMVVPVGSLRN